MNKKFVEAIRPIKTLYINELKKCINAKSTFLVFLVLVMWVGIFAIQLSNQSEEVLYTDYKVYLEKEIEDINRDLNDYGVGYSVGMRDYYLNRLETYKYMLEHNIAPYKTHSITNFVLLLNDAFAIIVILSVIVVSKIVTDEYKYSTIGTLVSVPCKRYKILLAKILAMITICIMMIFLLYVISFIIGGIFFGFDGITSPVVMNDGNKLSVRNAIEQSLVNNYYNMFTLIGCSSLVLLISILLKSGIVSTCSGIILYMLGSNLTITLKDFGWVKYSLFANMQFQMYVNGDGVIEGITPGFSIMVILLHSLVFLLIGFWVFNKRNIYE